jgi:hypothetical protein
MIIRRIAFGVFSLLFLSVAFVFAQVKKKKPATTTNVIVYADQDTIVDTTTGPRYFLFPEFYSYWPIENNDTIIKYQCYDADNAYINVDTLHDPDDIQHILFVKTFTNYLHTYIDPEGKPRPSTATKTIYRYDKTDDNTWKGYDIANNYTSELKEFKQDIVRIDTTTVVNPINHGKQLTIRKYYKVVEQKKQGEIEKDK